MFVPIQNNFRTNDKKQNKSEKLKNIPSSTNHSFLEILEEIVPSGKKETQDLNSLWQELPNIEKEFLAIPNTENLEIYKSHIQKIIQIVLSQNMKVERLQKRRSDGNKIYYIVDIINDKIQLLANLITNPNNAAFLLMKKMMDIRGLIIDLQK